MIASHQALVDLEVLTGGDPLLEGWLQLDYLGYHSAGIDTVNGEGPR